MEGCWFVQYRFGKRSSEGIAILRSGMLFGGDLEHCWKGTYEVDGSRLYVRLRVIPAVSNPDEEVMARDHLIILCLAGYRTETFARLEGSPEHQEKLHYEVLMRKCAAPSKLLNDLEKVA